MTLDITLPGGQTLVATHRAMWALGDYALMAEEVMAPLGPILVAADGHRTGRSSPRRRRRFREYLAAGRPRRVPTVVSTDLTPELLRRSQSRAAMQGLPLHLPGGRRAGAAV